MTENEPLLGRKPQVPSIQYETTDNGDSYMERSTESIDLEDNKDREGHLTCHLALAIAACILGSPFMFGINNAVINTPAGVIKDFYNTTHFNRNGNYLSGSSLTLLWAITVSIYAIGGMVGGLSAGYFANKYGRKGLILRNCFITFVAGGLLFFPKLSKSYEMLIAGRFVAGIAAGVSTVVGPLYLSEIAPIRLRGFSGTFYQLASTTGVVTSEILGLDKVLGTPELWPYALGFTIVPAIYQLLTMSWCPETPRYLMIYKYDDVKAEEALSWLRGKSDVQGELLEMQEEREKHDNDNNKFKFIDLFLKEELRWPVIISLMMQLSQQFSGINAVIYYSTSIFEKAGLSEQNAQYATIGSGSVNMLMTFISAVLIDRLGRRTLYLASLIGLFLSSLTLSVAEIFQSEDNWLTILCIVAVSFYLLSFGTGTGSIPWFFVAELFSQNSRPAAVSLATLVNWSSNFVVGIVFPELQKSIGPYSFIPFVCLLVVFLIFAFFKVPETKGKTIEEITAMFKKDNLDLNKRTGTE